MVQMVSWPDGNFRANCLVYTLSDSDISTAMVVFSSVLIAIGLGSAYLLHNQKRRLGWIISLTNSFVLMTVGIGYVAVKVPTFDSFFCFGDNGRIVFHSLDNVSVLVCIWFTLANIFDLVFGILFYAKHLDPLTAYVHHTVYIWILVAAITGNGGFAHFEPFAAGPVYMFVEEIPTFLLALGAVFPACRTDVGFGVTFFWLRLVYHAYMLLYSLRLQVDAVIPVMYALTLALHAFWFHTWMRKYGWRLLAGWVGGKGAAAKGRPHSD